MPIEVEAIRNRVATCTVEVSPGASVVFEYIPVRLAEEIESGDLDVERPETVQDTREELARQLVAVTAAWDVTRDGEPFPLDADEIADTFDVGFLSKCTLAIAEHYLQGKVTGELLSKLGTVTTSPKVGAESSPVGAANRVSRRSARSPKSRSSAASSRGRLQSIPSGSLSSLPAHRPATAS